MSSAFIFYRRVDSAALATLIAFQLKEKHGIDAYVDTRNADGGGPFPDRLRGAIERSDVFICLLAETSLDPTSWVQTEIEHAHNLRKTMIPVFQERYVAPSPIPNKHVEALLQSDGVQFLDVRNLYIDQAITQLAVMIRNSSAHPIFAPVIAKVTSYRRSTLLLSIILLVTIILTSLIILNINPFRPTATPIPIGFPSNPITNNTDWKPIYKTFDDVEMALVPVGCFIIGSENGQPNEMPINQQCFEQPFWIDRYEVTNKRYGSEGYFKGDNYPRDSVNWFQARDFCTIHGARLPTESEWEYAARGPDNLVYPWGNNFNPVNVVYNDNSGSSSAEIGSRSHGNSWVGISNLSGNLWEWVSSIFRRYPYNEGDGREVEVNNATSLRVLRGGSWNNFNTDDLRSSYRYSAHPDIFYNNFGFRCARSFEP